MEATKLKVKPFDGGEEREFFAVPPAQFRAYAVLCEDPEFSGISGKYRDYIIGAAFVMLSAKKRGLARALCIPGEITVESVDEWSSRYCVETFDDSIPDEPSGDADAEQLKNPTEPKE